MKADFSRRSEKKDHYRNVLFQQGRVWLDSDWNEDEATRTYQDEERTLDLVGPSGVPAPYEAFNITAIPGGADFHIGGGDGPAGDFYIDGILCRNEKQTSYLHQPDFPSPPVLPQPQPGFPTFALAYLEVWQRLITYLEDPSIREVALGGPDTAVRSQTVAQVKLLDLASGLSCADAANLLPSPLGNGTLTTLKPPPVSDPTDICRLPEEITFTGRDNRLYRVEIHEGGDLLDGGASGIRFSFPLASAANANTTSIELTAALGPAASDNVRRGVTVTLVDPNTGRRESVLVTGLDTSGKKLFLYSSLRNSFPIGSVVTGGVALFKWSRSNAAFAAGVKDVSVDRTKLTLTTLGRDDATALRQGDLVEITDDVSELGPGHGFLTHLKTDPNPDELTVELENALPLNVFDKQRHMTLRRWDGQGFASTTFDELGDMNLGDGVHVQFAGSGLRAGEYWQFATRVIDGSVESLVNAKPHGIVRHRCPLRVMKWTSNVASPPFGSPPSTFDVLSTPLSPASGSAASRLTFGSGITIGSGSTIPTTVCEVLSDCRPKIPLLTRMLQLHYVGGDAQEIVAATGALPLPLEVGVTDGPFALPGAKVKFSTLTSGGQEGVVSTGADGVAQFNWTPPQAEGEYQLRASLQLSPEDDVLCDPLSILFHCKVDADCCLHVRPQDLANTTLQNIVDRHRTRPVKICLGPGRYELPAPLVLTGDHKGMTIEGCGRGVIITSTSGTPFVSGMVHLLGTSGVTLRNLEFEPPRAKGGTDITAIAVAESGTPEQQKAGSQGLLPVFGPQIDVNVAVRIVGAEGCTIEQCRFVFLPRGVGTFDGVEVLPAPVPFGAALLTSGELKDCVFRNNTVVAPAPISIAGFVLVPAVFESSGKRRYQSCAFNGVHIENNEFSGLSHAVIACGALGELSVRENSIADCGHGVMFLSVRWFPCIAAAGDIKEVTKALGVAAKAFTAAPLVALLRAMYTVFHPSIAVPLGAYATLAPPPGIDEKSPELTPGATPPSTRLVDAASKFAVYVEPTDFEPLFEQTVVDAEIQSVTAALEAEWQSSSEFFAFDGIGGGLLRSSNLTPLFDDAAAKTEGTLDLSHNTISRSPATSVALLTVQWADPPTPATGAGSTVNPSQPNNETAREGFQPSTDPIGAVPGPHNRSVVSSNDLRKLASDITKPPRFFPAAVMLFDRRCAVTGNVFQNEMLLPRATPLIPSPQPGPTPGPTPGPAPGPTPGPPPVTTFGVQTKVAASTAKEPLVLGTFDKTPEHALSLVMIPVIDRMFDVPFQIFARRASDVPPATVVIVPPVEGGDIHPGDPVPFNPTAFSQSPLFAVAITGNVFVDWPLLPIRTYRHRNNLPPWLDLNTIVD